MAAMITAACNGAPHAHTLEQTLRAASKQVSLNLSGTVFITTRDTLERDTRTYFAAMLRMALPPPPPTEPPAVSDFFIDRDPTHFRYVLNYLRDSHISLESRGQESIPFLVSACCSITALALLLLLLLLLSVLRAHLTASLQYTNVLPPLRMRAATTHYYAHVALPL
jgi:BTB/POZ domain